MTRVRAAEEQDHEAMLRILARSPEAGAWSAEDFSPPRRCRVAERAGRVVGLLLAQCTTADEAEILTLAVDPAARREGIATALLRAFLAEHRGRVWLEVRASNSSARRLYAVFGFVEAGIRSGYYSRPNEDAIVMQLVDQQ